jgi:hypothetical protein
MDMLEKEPEFSFLKVKPAGSRTWREHYLRGIFPRVVANIRETPCMLDPYIPKKERRTYYGDDDTLKSRRTRAPPRLDRTEFFLQFVHGDDLVEIRVPMDEAVDPEVNMMISGQKFNFK